MTVFKTFWKIVPILCISVQQLTTACKTEESMMESWVCGKSTVRDIDGNMYKTVLIGSQCWMAENLKSSKFKDGTTIPLDESGSQSGDAKGETWSSRLTGARAVYEHNNQYLNIYGYLYNWYAAADNKGLCPEGWHVPTDSDWNTLVFTLGGERVAGGKLKSTGYWDSPNLGASNSSGFNALPAGGRPDYGKFSFLGRLTGFWSSTESKPDEAWYRLLNLNGPEIERFDFGPKKLGLSIRCLKD